MALQEAIRLFDSKPIVAHLYVTDQCNLDCHYCNEYDNSSPHPELSDLKKYLQKIRELGVLRIGLQGGEPLLYPHIMEVIRYAKGLGFTKISMSTNGFMLTEKVVRELEVAGLDVLQISVDRMTPLPSTRKSFKSIAPKLELFKNSNLKVHISGVLFENTLEEMEQVLDYSLQKGFAAHARVVHEDLVKGKGVQVESQKPMQDFLELQEQRKKRGEKIHSSWNLIDYEKKMLKGEEVDWTCVAGYKYFFVSSKGEFWLCSQVRTKKSIMDITPEELKTYYHKKDCQKGCGVYCIVATSLLINHRASFLARELKGNLQSAWNRAFNPSLGNPEKAPS
ncbi:MAG: radical SAM protein [Deltaproteobacteria bacterium]|nr:radical SAM protein [Deltaproteobacteria bacterium]